MGAMHVKMIMINIFMPMFMILGAILRPSFISLVYILLAFSCAFLPTIRSNAPFPKTIYCYSIFCLLVTLLTSLSQFAYQLYQYFEIPDEEYAKYCNTSSIDYWFRQAGFIRVPLISDIIVLRLFLPEIFALLGALLTFIICTIFPNEVQPSFGFAECSITEQQETELSSDQTIPTHNQIGNCQPSNDFPSTWFIAASMRISDALIVFMSCFVGALNPSILNLPYFLFFLTTMTWWALYTPLRRRMFNYMKEFFKLYLAFHFMLIFAYQIESFQQILPPTDIIARLLGLSPLILPSTCLNWYNLDINQSIGLIPFINFGSLLALFYVLSIQYCWTKDGIKPKRRLYAFVPYGSARTTVETIPIQQVGSGGESSSLHEELLPERPTTESDTVDVIPHNLQLQRITSEVMDRHRIAQMIRTRRKSEPGSFLVEAAQEFLYFCLYHCYVFALLSMMMWAILYHSVFGLIFLIMACAIWALVDSRRWAYGLSPLLLAYTEFLLLAQYVYSMQFNKGEIPSGPVLEIIGFKLEDDRLIAFRTILLKVLFSLPFYILLRLHLREDFYNSLSGRDRLKHINYGTFGDKHYKYKERKLLSHPHLNDESPFVFISKLLTKYWIFLVVFCILINTPLIGENNLFSIGFFLFFVTLLVVFQLSFRFFRATIFGFLTLLITYSSLILIAIYCYQFPGIPEFWQQITGFTDAFSHDIGLYDYQEKQFGALFERLIKIIALIVVTMLQLKFFHDPWIKLTKTPNTSQLNMEEEVTDLNRTDIRSLIMTAFDLWKCIKEFVWRFAEVHLHKFILFILLIVCIEHFCLLNLLPIILIAVSLTLTSSQSIILALCGYLSFLFVIRRVYGLQFVPTISKFIIDTEATCTWENENNFTDVKDFGTIEKWLGIQRNDPWIASDILGIILVLILIGIQYCIKYRQINNRKLLGQPEPAQGILFPDANPKDFDKSLVDCFKFFLNYGFYKFGVEVSLSAMAFAAWLRMDGLAAILTGWLFVMMMLPRQSRKIFWPFLVAYLIIMLPLEYLMAIGLPHNQCIAYPWTEWKLLFNLPPNLLKWEYLNNNLSYLLSIATYRLEPGRFAANLKIDFVLLAIVAAQNRVFGQENEQHPAGSNDSIYVDGKYKLFKQNPHYDFIVEQRSFVDFFKYIVFMYGHWISMVMVLCAGLGSTSLFALGYVVLAFWMLWQGNNLYTMRNYSKTLAKWNLLAYYTITIMFCKIILQFVGCVFIGFLNESYVCPIQQLFSIFCSNEFANKQIRELTDANNEKSANGENIFSNFQKCTADGKWASEANIGFDAVAFLFIIFQLRILHSWFFQRSMIEFQCEVIQANRGAILINQLIEKEMREQTEQQNKKLREIKERTAAIRKRYEEQQKRSSGYGSLYFTPETYGQAQRPLSIIDIDDPLPSYDPRYAHSPQSPGLAKRAGDYYMFDYDPEFDELVEPVESFVPEVTPGAGDFDKLDPAQLLHTALGKDLNLIGTLDSVEEAEQIKDEKLRMIAAIAPSKKAREIAKRALFHRQHPEQQTGSNLLHQMEEDEATKMAKTLTGPSTSTEPRLRFDDEQDDEDEIPTIRLRKKGSKSEELEIQPAEEGIRKEDEIDGVKEIEEKPKSWNKAILSVFRFIWKIVISILDFCSAFLNRRSREHRYVAYVLHKEKQHLKDMMTDELYDGQFTSQELRDRWESRNMHMVSSEADIRRLEDEAHTRWEERNVFARFITAIGNCICAHTDIICYSLAVYVHGWTAGLITLPLPALVFLWGTLANPRPSKFFWVTMIFYTELEIIFKFAFQFGFWSWNTVEFETLDYTKTYKPQYLLGIQRVEYFALNDVALLISLFFHRYMLRKLGLWRDANSDKLLVTPSSSPTPVHANANGRTRRNGNGGSAATESTNADAAAHIQLQESEIDHDNIDVEAGENKHLPQIAEEMPPSGNPGTTTTKIPTKITDMNIIGRFITKLIYPKFRYIRDFYPLMFFLDVFSMFVVAINYSSFGEGGSGDVVSDIKSNRVPIMLVVILLIQSLMIVVDRGLYLRKAVIAKLVYHLFTLVLIHVWIFFILPAFTQKEAFVNRAAKFLYFVKCVYFLISAWQIRNGYPSLCIGNLLTHSYGLINMILFKAFMLTPFVFELRTAIDWTWTDTSMPIFDYFNMENFYATIYNLKCARKFEDSFPAPRGEAKGSVIKYMMGLPLILIIILLIWSPIIAFSLINTIGNVSPPESAIMTVSLEGFPPLYKMEAKGSGLTPILSEEYDQLIRDFSNFADREAELGTDLPERSRMAVAYISQYTNKDILRVKFRPESESFWEISPDSLIALTDLLKNNTGTELKLSFQFEFTRKQKDKDAAKVHSFSHQVKINGLELLDAIQNSQQWFNVSNVLPTYFVIPSEGEATIARLLQNAAERRTDNNPNETATYNKFGMKLQKELTANSSYWLTQMEFNSNISKLTKIPTSERIDYGTKDKNYTEFVALVDRVFPSWLNNYVQGGIILMYMGVILVIGRLIRGFISSQPLDVIVNEIPNPDYLLKICLDIYLVREARDFVLEQDLFAKLIFLFRSPQTLIKWTRYKAKPE